MPVFYHISPRPCGHTQLAHSAICTTFSILAFPPSSLYSRHVLKSYTVLIAGFFWWASAHTVSVSTTGEVPIPATTFVLRTMKDKKWCASWSWQSTLSAADWCSLGCGEGKKFLLLELALFLYDDSLQRQL